MVTAATLITTHPLATGVPPGWASGWGQDRYGVFAEFRVGTIRQRMRWIPPGRFAMGSPDAEPERWPNERLHEVEIRRGFWLADTACTQALWQEVTGANPSHFPGSDLPVESVSWNDINLTFLPRLAERRPDLELRLPIEAEWEYACRAGTTTPFSFGANITTDQVNYDGNYPYSGGDRGEYRQKTVPVATLPANPWGLYEMHGNVYEWCADWYGEYQAGAAVEPGGPGKGSNRVLRGGSWHSNARLVRSAYRNAYEPGNRCYYAGFRLARGQ